MKMIYRKLSETALPVTRSRLSPARWLKTPEGGTLTGAPKNPNKTFRLFVFENMRSSPNDRVRLVVPQAPRWEARCRIWGSPNDYLVSTSRSGDRGDYSAREILA